MKNLVLIGMPGCGKSVIGEKLAQELEMEFVDLDKYIEASTELAITEIFKNGETEFRDIEAKSIVKISNKDDIVISTGGGVVKNYENIINLKKNGVIIYINRSIDNISADIEVEHRPLLSKDPSQLYKLFEERHDLYKKYCDYEIMNNTDIDEVVCDIIKVYTKISR